MAVTTTWSDGNVVIRLDMTELQSLIDNLDPRGREIVGKVAYRAEGHMKQLAAVDTGAMKNSIDTEYAVSSSSRILEAVISSDNCVVRQCELPE